MHIILIALLGLIVYSNTFRAPFTFDDEPNISQNMMIRDLSNIPSMFWGYKGTFASRPLLHATDALNYRFGGLEPGGYHYVNLALHLLNAMLLYLLVVATGKLKGFPEDKTTIAAAIASLVFVAHPAQTEAVTYIVSRSMLFATTFYLLGTILFIRAATSEKRRGFYAACLFAVSLLGMSSREDFATFPAMLVLYDLLFISDLKPREVLRHYRAHLPAIAGLGYLFYLVSINSYDTRAEYFTEHIPALKYALTQFNVHWTYVRLLALPMNQNLDYGYPIARTLFEFPTMLSFVGYAAAVAVALLFARKRPTVSFCILWFLVALLPISFGVTLVKGLKLDDVIFEHRLYLPSAGLIALSGAAAASFYGSLKTKRARASAVAAFLVFLVALSSASYARNHVWRSKTSLWEDAAAKSPRKSRTHFNLGVAYGIGGKRDKAVAEYKAAIAIEPTSPMPHVNLGNAYRSMGMGDKAAYHYDFALAYDPDNPEALKGLGVIYASQGMEEQAIRQYKLALSNKPNDAIAHANLGIAYKRAGKDDLAAEEFRQAVRLNPGIVMSFVNHGAMYLSMGQPDMAIEQIEKALVIEPGNPSAHFQLGKAYSAKGMDEKAAEHFNLAHEGLGAGMKKGEKHP